MKNLKIGKYQFFSLDEALKKDLKNKKFKRLFDEEMNRLQLGHEVKNLRKAKRMTQAQVAKKAHMPQSVIARIESGTHSFSIATLQKVAQVFETRIALVAQSKAK